MGGRIFFRAILALTLFPSALWAHPVLRNSSPARDARLSAAPFEIRLTFSEGLSVALSHIELRSAAGSFITLDSLRRGASDGEIFAPVSGEMSSGSYTVSWRVTGDDGHTVTGSYSFQLDLPADDSVQLAEPVSPVPTAADSQPAMQPESTPVAGKISASYAAARWSGFIALFVVLGAIAMRLIVIPGSLTRGAAPAAAEVMDARTRVLGVLGVIFLFATALARLVAQTSEVEGGAATFAGMSAVLAHSLWGVGWVLLVASGIAVLVWVTRSGRSARALWPLALAGALGLAVSGALSGHAAASDYSALAVAADSIHVLGAAGWMGTLLVVAAAGLPGAGAEPGKRATSISALVNAFSPVALTCASLVVVTGIVSAWLRLQHWDALVDSRYGTTLLIKLAVLIPALALGAFNWRKVRPSLEQPGAPARLAGTVSVELSLGALVLAVTAVLVATPLPR